MEINRVRHGPLVDQGKVNGLPLSHADDRPWNRAIESPGVIGHTRCNGDKHLFDGECHIDGRTLQYSRSMSIIGGVGRWDHLRDGLGGSRCRRQVTTPGPHILSQAKANDEEHSHHPSTPSEPFPCSPG